MDQKSRLQIEELQRELQFLRERNLALLQEMEEMRTEISKLRTELASRGKQPGRKKHNAEWSARYARFVSMMRSGRKPSEIISALSIGRTTYYRYREQYLLDMGLTKGGGYD